jgi:hypothetical protein
LTAVAHVSVTYRFEALPHRLPSAAATLNIAKNKCPVTANGRHS